MLELRLLGAIDLRSPDLHSAQSVLTQPKRIAVLIYLALATPRGFQRRDKLLALFWPDSDETHARGALNQALYQLRQLLGEEAFLTRGDEEVGLNWEKWWCDAVELRAAAAAERYDDVLQLVRGELLDGFHAHASPEFEQWLDAERAAAHKAALAAALDLAGRAEAGRHYAEAIQALRRASEIEPLNEDVAARLMQLLHRSGNDAEALSAYETHAARAAAELGEAPSEKLAALAQAVRQGSSSPKLPSAERSSRRRVLLPIGLSALAVLGLAVVAMIARYPRTLFSTGALRDRDLILISDFRNTTADTSLGGVVTELLRVDMGQSSSVRLLAPAEVLRALQRMQRDSAHVLVPSVAREVALREGAKAVLEGEIGSIGNGYALVATLVEPTRGTVLASFRTTAANPDELISSVERLSRSVRRRIGERLRTIRASPPLPQVTTASLPALREYTTGYAAWRAGNHAEAGAHFERAISLDTTFASAYRALAVMLITTRPDKRIPQWLTRAYSYRERLPEFERAMTEGTYHRVVTRDYAKAIAAFTEAFEAASHDPSLQAAPLEHLGGIYLAQGDFARAESTWRDRISRDTTSTLRPAPYEYNELLGAQLWQGNIAAINATLRAGNRLFGENKNWWARWMIPLWQEDYDVALEQVQKDGYRGSVSDLLFLRGRIAESQAVVPDSFRVTRLRRQLNLAQLDLHLRNDPEAAVRRLSQALKGAAIDSLKDEWRPFVNVIALYADAGEPALARQWIALRREAAPQTIVGYRREPPADRFVAGVLALAERHPDVAIREIKADAAGCPTCYLPELAMAYQANGQIDSTIAVFERYTRLHPLFVESRMQTLTRTGLVRVWALYPVIHLRLAELYERKKDAANAARHYAAFIELWKNADPDLQPYVATARQRLARIVHNEQAPRT